MAETYAGEVKGGVVVFDEGAPRPPEGTRVRVAPSGPSHPIPTLAERYANIIGIAEGLPPDMAQGHDQVRVEPTPEAETLADLSRRLLSIAGIAEGLPEDFAEQHDHYIHGTPKR